MKIEYLDLENVKELASIYNEQITDIPHCYSVSPEEFENGVRCQKDVDKPYDNLHSEKIIIGETVGFADVAVVDIEEDSQVRQEGMIRFMTYQPGYRSIGQAILNEAERYLRDLGMKQVRVYYDNYSYRFYHMGFGMVSDLKGHLCSLLFMNGYEVEGGEMFMDQPEYKVSEPLIPDNKVEIVVEQKPGRGVLPGLIVRAFRGRNEIGICRSVSAGQYCQAIEAQDWVFVKWLGVEEEERRKGWGRYLLLKNLWEMQKIGYNNTIISTNIKNHRAQLFYTNYGYRVVDTCYEFVKDI